MERRTEDVVQEELTRDDATGPEATASQSSEQRAGTVLLDEESAPLDE
eukprot:CAMPEP_0113526268 /NCGR_PEP_ID=MMETSP0015_2-20120614/646_1 /TAXON_ID=2838 /ORGANISM="Odontella" /LENGTH=47 /DNA_ID=CAMNT_0000424573 /DNA_START=576 /DNA_END=716 /DNA_ORIENTATION=+ /assembly_acc=CAM_ASM_000160